MITIAQTIEKRGEVRGKQESRLAIAKNMLTKGYAIKDIEEITGLTREAIEKLKQE
jgi:predicted transposase/invertase (TIGR01784 family)